MKKLAIIGSSLLGKLITYHAENDFEVVGYYDDFTSGKNVLGKTENILKDFENKKFDCLIIGIGYAQMKARVELFNRYKNKIPFANVIHSSSYIDKSVKLGEGIFILPGCTIDMECELGDNVLCNTGCTIAHHTTINSHCFLGPSVSIAGLVNVNMACFIGVGSTLKDSITIGQYSIIGAGSVVIKDIEERTVSVGVPAKVIKKI